MNRNCWFHIRAFFVHFWVCHESGPTGEVYNYIGVAWPTTMYIYSLGHFLTTKGALIDGDGYPPKNPKNDPKKVTKMMKNWSKLMTKKCQKTRFLMWKSTFSVKFTQLTWKTVKNDQKLTQINDTKLGHNLTTKRGDSGSAGMLEEKCVINEALNLDTKMDTNWSQQQKINKNQQKSTKSKNRKNQKIRKTEKVTKPENAKSEKVTKCKTQKVTKKCEKVTPPQKGQNVT